jgi:pimeloyl-ACP methyl ester carboxylesterase
MAADVLRYMWENKLSTATLAGHGIGGRIALATGCYYPERSTGAFVVDASPMDIRYHEAFKEVRTYIERLSKVDMGKGRAEVEN